MIRVRMDRIRSEYRDRNYKTGWEDWQDNSNRTLIG
jgi:hypothetical protein